MAPTQKCSPWLATTIARKSLLRASRPRRASISMTSGSMLFAFVLNVRPSTPSPRSHASAPSFLSTGAPPLRSIVSVALRGSISRCDVRALGQVEDLPSSRVEARRARGAHLVDRRGQRDAVLLHAVDAVSAKPSASQVSNGPELPVVAPPHGVIDRDHAVGDLADAARRVRERAREHLPRELARPCPGRRRACFTRSRGSSIFAERLGGVLDRLVAALGAVLERLRVERLDLPSLPLLVEAALGLVAEQLLLDHRPDVRRHLEDLALLVAGERGVAVVGDVHERVEADEVRRAEARALGVAPSARR